MGGGRPLQRPRDAGPSEGGLSDVENAIRVVVRGMHCRSLGILVAIPMTVPYAVVLGKKLLPIAVTFCDEDLRHCRKDSEGVICHPDDALKRCNRGNAACKCYPARASCECRIP